MIKLKATFTILGIDYTVEADNSSGNTITTVQEFKLAIAKIIEKTE